MLISPHEQERLLIHVAAGLARERRARGLKLNYPEAVALITSFLLEGARDGRPVVELMAAGRDVLTRGDAADQGQRDGGGARYAPRGPGRGPLPRWHQPGHGARADPVSSASIIP